MAVNVYRSNTLQSKFPMLSIQAGRAIIDPRYDQTYVPGVNPVATAESRGIPGILYMQNVLPTDYGWQSVGFEEKVSELAAGTHYYKRIDRILGSGSTLKWLVSGSFNDVPQIMADGGGSPTAATFVPALGAGEGAVEGSVGTVNGISYVRMKNNTNYKFNGNSTFNSVTLTGLSATIDGLLDAFGYLIAWEELTSSIAWSSVTNPEDFTPSLTTGAGGGSVQDAQGRIVFCTKTHFGFFIICERNIVAAVYTGNKNFPWSFRAVPGSGGQQILFGYPPIVSSPVDGWYYVWTKKGLQRVNENIAESVFVDITEFMLRNVYETFEPMSAALSLNTFSNTSFSSIQTVVGARYLCLSYGKLLSVSGQDVNKFEGILVVDLLTNRYGKIIFDHSAVVDLGYSSVITPVTRNRLSTIGILKSNGEIYQVYMDFTDQTVEQQGVIMFGPYQHSRGRWIHLHEIELEFVDAGITEPECTVKVRPSYDGKTLETTVDGVLNQDTLGKFIRRYFVDTVGLNHIVIVQGSFSINTLLLHYSLHGREN